MRALRLLLPLLRPFLVTLAHVRERLAERSIEIAVEARERAILLDVDAQAVRIEDAGAHMDVHDLADREAALTMAIGAVQLAR